MSVGTPQTGAVGAMRPHARTSSDSIRLRALAIAVGISWAVAFVLVGLRYQLQTYGDGSIFSYAVAVRDGWAFHFHNISGRLFVYLFAVAPAEFYVGLTGDPRGGIMLYGLLFFATPLTGLGLAYLADRSPGRTIFTFGCASTACLCPLVFGFPTEMWMAHALFWPALAICHYAPRDRAGYIMIFVILLALVFTHAGSAIFIFAILLSLWLRGAGDPALSRVLWILVPVLTVWLAVRTFIAPDDYFAPVLARAAWKVFDWNICTSRMVILLASALGGYAVLCSALRHFTPGRAAFWSALAVGAVLAAYWLCAYNPVHAERRYYMRTLLIVFAPVFGMAATIIALEAGNLLRRNVPYLPQVFATLRTHAAARTLAGAFAIVALIHAVETAKFVEAWSDYRIALTKLAAGSASDPAIGDPRYVSSARIDNSLQRLSWWSTTPYLSVLVTPNMAPVRVVFDPNANYFWLPCNTATTSAYAQSSVPQDTRRLIAKYSCLHRR